MNTHTISCPVHHTPTDQCTCPSESPEGVKPLPDTRTCDRCDKPEWQHSGLEKFCPFYSTFRARRSSEPSPAPTWDEAAERVKVLDELEHMLGIESDFRAIPDYVRCLIAERESAEPSPAEGGATTPPDTLRELRKQVADLQHAHDCPHFVGSIGLRWQEGRGEDRPMPCTCWYVDVLALIDAAREGVC